MTHRVLWIVCLFFSLTLARFIHILLYPLFPFVQLTFALPLPPTAPFLTFNTQRNTDTHIVAYSHIHMLTHHTKTNSIRPYTLCNVYYVCVYIFVIYHTHTHTQTPIYIFYVCLCTPVLIFEAAINIGKYGRPVWNVDNIFYQTPYHHLHYNNPSTSHGEIMILF